MGCGASAQPTPATEAHALEMCDVAARDMEILCVTHAMSGISEGKLKVAVRTPPCVDSWRETVKELREKANQLKEDGAAGTGNKAAGAAAAVATGGALGGMLSKIGTAADSLADAAANVAGSGAAMGVDAVADTLEKAIDTLQGPFEKVGKEVIDESYTDMLAAFSEFITKYKFAHSLNLIRGGTPYEDEQYRAANKRGISQALVKSAANDIVAKVLPTTETAIKKSTALSAWNKMIETNKSVCGTITSLADSHSSLSGLKDLIAKLEATTNMPEHITTEIVLVICEHMGAREEEIRNDSSTCATNSKKDATFKVVFSGQKIMESHYKEFMSN